MNAVSVPSPIGARIHIVRGQSVMLDSDLADIYGVLTKNLNKAVGRNQERFPEKYCFQLTQEEWVALRFQIGTLNAGRGRHRKFLPYVFTEHGAVMLAAVLNSSQAVQASLAVVDAFVHLRHILDNNLVFTKKLDELSAKVVKHDRAFVAVFEELKRLAGDLPPEPPKGRIGFKTE